MSLTKRQRGATLIVALIMLILLTIIAVSAINSSTTSVQTTGNMQFRDETVAVAQQGIEQVISSNFTVNPVATPISVDINQDGHVDYAGTVAAPTCTSSIPLSNFQLNPQNPADAPCVSSGQATTTGIVGASGVVSSTPSWCYKQTWDVQATVDDSGMTGAKTVVHQGVFLRVPIGTGCP